MTPLWTPGSSVTPPTAKPSTYYRQTPSPIGLFLRDGSITR
jgi:hypothetical protein